MNENPYVAPDHAGDLPIKKGPRVWVVLLTLFGIGGVLFALFLPAQRVVNPTSRRMACGNNLKQIAWGLHSYIDVFHALPPAYTVDANGKPLHSWRTLLLPFVEEKRLYDTIDLSKPWDDPVNAKAFNTTLAVYSCPADDGPGNHTLYLASVAPNGCFRLTKSRLISDIVDDASNTLMLIEVAPEQSVPWMSPRDADESFLMSFGPKSKMAHPGGTHAAMCNGQIRFLPADMPAAERRTLISSAGHDNGAADHK